MPNINTVETMQQASDTTSYFIMSNGGLVRRFRFDYLKNQIAASVPGANRTDQNLFTTSSVIFNSVSLTDFTSPSAQESKHAFTTNFYHATGGAIRFQDGLGALRFGGFDGAVQTIQDRNIAPFQLTAFAAEDWANNGSLTTSAGVGWTIAQQPAGVRLSATSRQRVIQVTSNVDPVGLTPPVFNFQLGSIGSATYNNTTVSSNGVNEYKGPGRTDIFFVNARLHQVGMPNQPANPNQNATLNRTNIYTFETSRNSTFVGFKNAMQDGDVIGQFEFRGINSNNSIAFEGTLTGAISVVATENFTQTASGSAILFSTQPQGGNRGPTDRARLHSVENTFASQQHSFRDNSQAVAMTVSTATVHIFSDLTFLDNSVQQTAWTGSPWTTVAVPATSTSTGVAGQIASDDVAVYLCIATDTWKKILTTAF